MARVSSAPEDAYHLSGKFADGWGKITDCKAVIFQFPPQKEAKNDRAAGHQDPPALFAELTIQRYLDGDGNVSAEQPETKLLAIQRPGKADGVLACRPGNFPDGNLELEPEDAGSALGAEGNTVFADQDGFQFNDKCGWMSFTQSLVEDGFKAAILKRTYFPDFIGLYAFFETVTKPKFKADGGDPTAFVIKKGSTRIRPYEKQTAGAAGAAGAGAKKGTAAVKKPTAAAAATAVPASQSAAADNGAGAGDAEGIATAIITDTVAPAQKGVLMADVKKLKVTVLLAMNKHKPAVPAEMKKAVQDQLSDVEWLQMIGIAGDLYTFNEDGSVQFAA